MILPEMMGIESSASSAGSKASRAKKSTKEKKSKGKQSDVQLSEETGFPSFMTADQVHIHIMHVLSGCSPVAHTVTC